MEESQPAHHSVIASLFQIHVYNFFRATDMDGFL